MNCGNSARTLVWNQQVKKILEKLSQKVNLDLRGALASFIYFESNAVKIKHF